VLEILIVNRKMLVYQGANLNVDAVLNVIRTLTALLPNGEEPRRPQKLCVTRRMVTNALLPLHAHLTLIALPLASLPVPQQKTDVLAACLIVTVTPLILPTATLVPVM
jgi:hypothetical protein